MTKLEIELRKTRQLLYRCQAWVIVLHQAVAAAYATHPERAKALQLFDALIAGADARLLVSDLPDDMLDRVPAIAKMLREDILRPIAGPG
jgi:hypothetical protein